MFDTINDILYFRKKYIKVPFFFFVKKGGGGRVTYRNFVCADAQRVRQILQCVCVRVLGLPESAL